MIISGECSARVSETELVDDYKYFLLEPDERVVIETARQPKIEQGESGGGHKSTSRQRTSGNFSC